MRTTLRSAVLRILAAATLVGAADCDSIGEGAALTSLQIVKLTGVLGPSDNRVYVCFRDALQVRGIFSDGLVGDYTNRAVWESSNPQVVHVSNADITIPGDVVPGSTTDVFDRGTLIPKAVGTATISATFIGLRATFDVVVRQATRVNVAPATTNVASNSTVALTATGVFDGYTIDVTSAPEWVLDNPNDGPADLDGDGVANADDDCADTPYSELVNADGCPVTSIANLGRFTGLVRGVTPNARQFTARAKFLTCDITSAGSVAEPQNSSDTADFVVAAPQSIAMTRAAGGTTGDVVVNFSDKLVVTGTFADGTTQDLSNDMRLTIAPAGVVSVFTIAPNLVKGAAAGTATLSACYDPFPAQNDADPDVDTTDSCATTDPNRLVSNDVTLNAVAGTLNAVGIEPLNQPITARTDQQFTARGSFDNGARTGVDITREVVWTSSDPATAFITSGALGGGRAFSLKTTQGSVDITATHNDATVTKSATTKLCIYPPEVTARPCPIPPTP